MSKPNVLILGGAGFIGRSLAVYLVENDLAGTIRVVDKAIPQTSHFTPQQTAAFEKVQFVQGNLAKAATMPKAFDGPSFDFVINCAALTKYGQDEVVMKENVLDLTTTCAKEAAKRGVKLFVELSTGQVYDSDKKASDEHGKCKPWTTLGEMKLAAEHELAKIDGLNYIIVRPAIVYGVSDMLGIMPRLIIGAVYKKLGESMDLLWTDKLRLNTVHVKDVVRALWHLCLHGKPKEVYNLADKADTTQGTLSEMIAKLFGIKCGYVGSIMSNLAKLNMTSVTEDINEKHAQPWSDMCTSVGIVNTPLSPYLDKELLYNNSLSVDGSKIESLGFKYEYPAPTPELLKESVQAYIDLKIFPPGYLL